MLVAAVLWTAFFLINFNVVMMIPLLPFMQREIGVSTLQAGAVLAAFPITALAANLALGPFIDRLGRKRFILIGAWVSSGILLLTAACDNVVSLVLCRAAAGIFVPMIGASVFAAIADYVAPERRPYVSGYVATAAPIAFVVSISMGFLLAGLLSWRLSLVILAMVSLGLAVGATRLPPSPQHSLSDEPVSIRTYRARLFSIWTHAQFRRLFLAYLCWSMAIYAFLGLYPSWSVQQGLHGQTIGAIGAMLFVGEIGGLVGAGLSGRLSRLHGHPFGACAITAFVTAGLIAAVPFGRGVIGFQLATYVGFAFGRDVMLALILGGAMLLVPAAQRGSLNALMNATYQTGASLGGLAGAWLYELFPDFTGNAGVSALLLAISGATLWFARLPARAACPSG
jgi:MFS transporter, DHA1 family, multidrug resistance protein